MTCLGLLLFSVFACCCGASLALGVHTGSLAVFALLAFGHAMMATHVYAVETR